MIIDTDTNLRPVEQHLTVAAQINVIIGEVQLVSRHATVLLNSVQGDVGRPAISLLLRPFFTILQTSTSRDAEAEV